MERTSRASPPATRTRSPRACSISGVAPRAYLGNYKALTIPTDADVGLDGNSPELVAAIEAAVADGMDVINMSLGEPEIEPSHDIVVKALEAAARAGVVAVVSAGNDFDEFGRGSVWLARLHAERDHRRGRDDVTRRRRRRDRLVLLERAEPLSLRLKPDVSAPGAGILSAAPRSSYATLSGRAWPRRTCPAPSRSCSSGIPPGRPHRSSRRSRSRRPRLHDEAKADEVPTLRGGGGVINLPRADATPIFSSPVSFSFGLIRSNASQTRSVELTDSGLGGSGPWTVTVEAQNRPAGAALVAPATVTVPGKLDVTVRTTQATDAEATGYVVLTRGTERLRIPYWFGTGTPALAAASRLPSRSRAATRLRRRADDARPRYRYPESPVGFGFSTTLPGPERVFRVTLPRPAVNFGVVVTSRAQGVRVEPRIVRAGDERRLTGYAALPFNLNPYLRTFGELVLAAGTILPAAGQYDVVFDSPSAARAGPFTFRYWVNDVTPPALALRTRTSSAVPSSSSPPPTAAPASTRPRSLSRSTATSTRAGSRRAGSASTSPASGQDVTSCDSRPPTTRNPGTWRTSAGSCRTRASSGRRSSSAS